MDFIIQRIAWNRIIIYIITLYVFNHIVYIHKPYLECIGIEENIN